jgi:hypothetical protein
MSETTSRDAVAAVVAQWEVWASTATDRLLALEDRVRMTGSDTDASDVAAAFVARKAIVDRLDAVRARAEHDPDGAVVLAGAPVSAANGDVVGNGLADAATLLDAVLTRVERSVAANEQRSLDEVQLSVTIEQHLGEAGSLAEALGMQRNAVDLLRRRLSERRDLPAVAANADELLSDLRAASTERQTLLSRAGTIGTRLVAARELEARADMLAAECREKVVQAPPHAVPSVDEFGALPDPDELPAMSFTALRGAVNPVLMRLDRIEAALAEVIAVFQRPLARRDELRGLLQAYRDKARAAGRLEDPVLDPLYRSAADALWAAPCDLQRSQQLVDDYVRAVNGAAS